jgi:hypothetical protein
VCNGRNPHLTAQSMPKNKEHGRLTRHHNPTYQTWQSDRFGERRCGLWLSRH